MGIIFISIYVSLFVIFRIPTSCYTFGGIFLMMFYRSKVGLETNLLSIVQVFHSRFGVSSLLDVMSSAIFVGYIYYYQKLPLTLSNIISFIGLTLLFYAWLFVDTTKISRGKEYYQKNY